ncbi:MAG: Fic family protein [Bacteroidales bacterium]|jgi:Fic family protein|nr:Fic family protein [Bacteroidales bacterium]
MNTDDIWVSVEKLTKSYLALNLHEDIDYDKFYLYSIVTHSTAIEGSTLTEKDTQMLLDYGITAQGKPLLHHLMNKDLKTAYDYVIAMAKEKRPLTVDFLKKLNGLAMKSTGSEVSVMAGNFDSSKGDFRLCSVRAGIDGKSYIAYQKVPSRTEELCVALNERLKDFEKKSLRQQYEISFDAHLDLVTVHPWVDGNGRTSRLLMNFLQFYQGLVPINIRKEHKGEYIETIMKFQDTEDRKPFHLFMTTQLACFLKAEVQSTQNH